MESDEEERFKKFLGAKGLSQKTINDYTNYYKHFKPYTIVTEMVDLEECIIDFLQQHNNPVCRAMLLNWLIFKKRRDVELPKLSGHKPDKVKEILTIEEVRMMRDYFLKNNLKHGLMFILNYYLGLRVSELLHLKINSFLLEEWTKDRSKPCQVKIVKAKGNKERIIQLDSKFMPYLFVYLETKYLPRKEDDRLFRMTMQSWNRKLNETSIKLFNKPLHSHQLRRTRASHMLDAGIETIYIMKFLGHESIVTTQLYLNVNPMIQQKEIGKFIEEND